MRKQDSEKTTHFRAGDRMFCLNGDWYYQTREDDHGPFPSREAAQLDMRRYIDEMNYFDDLSDQNPSIATAGKSRDISGDFANFSLIEKD